MLEHTFNIPRRQYSTTSCHIIKWYYLLMCTATRNSLILHNSVFDSLARRNASVNVGLANKTFTITGGDSNSRPRRFKNYRRVSNIGSDTVAYCERL